MVAVGFAKGDAVLYRLRDDRWLPAVVTNVTTKRVWIRVDGTRHARGTVPSQLKSRPEEPAPPDDEHGPADQTDREGALFKLRVQKNHEARQAALKSIRGAGFGAYVFATIGGRLEGEEKLYKSRREAEHAVNTHYDRAMMQRVVEPEIRRKKEAR